MSPAAHATGTGNSAPNSPGIGKKTQFVLDCYARVDKGADETVFSDCFAPDYKMTGPETKMLSKDGSLHGKAAIDAMGAMNRNDSASFGQKDWTLVMSMEDDHTVVRRMRWTGKAPHGSYAGFENLPNDLTITGDAVLIDTLRDGKIADQFFVYDTMGFFMDLAQGDMRKMGAALVKMGDMMAPQKSAPAAKPTP
jgi:ketosteroid isomerase-like protein